MVSLHAYVQGEFAFFQGEFACVQGELACVQGELSLVCCFGGFAFCTDGMEPFLPSL